MADKKPLDALRGKVQELLDKTDIDEKIVAGAKGLKDKAQELLDKTDVDEKIVDGVKGAAAKVKDFLTDGPEKKA